MKKVPVASLLIAAGLVAALVTYAVTFQVRFSQVAVRVLLGKADQQSVVRQPGWHWKWPWPIETVVKYDRRLRVLDTPHTEIKTADNKNIIVGCFAIWRISDPLRFKIAVETVARAEELLRTRINQVRSAVVGRHQMSDFVNLDAEQLAASREQMEQEMRAAAAPSILRDYGVEVVRVAIRRISLPEDVSQKVFEAMIQERQKTAARYREEGAALAETIKAEAESAKNQILAFARRKAQEIESAGVRAATKTLARVRAEDKDLFIYLRYLDALKAALANKSTIFLDAGEELFKTFVRPPGAAPLPKAPAPPAEEASAPRGKAS